MHAQEEVVTEARRLAKEMQAGMRWNAQSTAANSMWWAIDISERPLIRARGTAGLELLRTYAGRESEWFRRATAVFDAGERKPIEHHVRGVSEILLAWASQVESGATAVVGLEAQSIRLVASTDVMEQVRVLNADKTVHPAAPIVLAGAALETALRGAVEERQLPVESKGSIATYAKALRSAEVISKQDMKDIEQMGGLRNAAAHGDFDELSRERAGLMEQQVNMFLARLEILFDA